MNRLRVLRAERRLTQLDLALKVGMKQTYYWRLENGYLEPSDTERAKLARALRVEESDLGFALTLTAAGKVS